MVRLLLTSVSNERDIGASLVGGKSAMLTHDFDWGSRFPVAPSVEAIIMKTASAQDFVPDRWPLNCTSPSFFLSPSLDPRLLATSILIEILPIQISTYLPSGDWI